MTDGPFGRDAVEALRPFLEGRFTYDLADDHHLRVVAAPLPDRAVVGAARKGNTLWIIVDISKEDSLYHLRRLVVALSDMGELPAVADIIRTGTPFLVEDVTEYGIMAGPWDTDPRPAGNGRNH